MWFWHNHYVHALAAGVLQQMPCAVRPRRAQPGLWHDHNRAPTRTCNHHRDGRWGMARGGPARALHPPISRAWHQRPAPWTGEVSTQHSKLNLGLAHQAQHNAQDPPLLPGCVRLKGHSRVFLPEWGATHCSGIMIDARQLQNHVDVEASISCLHPHSKCIALLILLLDMPSTIQHATECKN